MDGEDDGVCLCGDGVEVAVVAGVEGGADAEGAAVDVDEEGEFVGRRGGVWGEVEASADAGLGVDGDVFGFDGSGGIGAGGSCFGAEEALDAAVFVETEEVGELTDNLVVGVWIHGDE